MEYEALVKGHWQGKNCSTGRRTCHSATLSIRNHTWTCLAL